MTLPREKLNELKQLIHDHLDRMDIHGKIRDCVSESMRDQEEHAEGLSEEELIRTMQEKGIIEDVMRGLEFRGIEKKPIRSQNITQSSERRSRVRGQFLAEKEHMECMEFDMSLFCFLFS